MIHFSVLRVSAPQVFEDECEVSHSFHSRCGILILADSLWFVWSTNSAFTKSSCNMLLPRGISRYPIPFAVHFYFAIQFHFHSSTCSMQIQTSTFRQGRRGLLSVTVTMLGFTIAIKPHLMHVTDSPMYTRDSSLYIKN
jgi:hypothetical protein